MRQEKGDVEDVKNKHLLSTIASLLLVKKLFFSDSRVFVQKR